MASGDARLDNGDDESGARGEVAPTDRALCPLRALNARAKASVRDGAVVREGMRMSWIQNAAQLSRSFHRKLRTQTNARIA